MKEDTEVTNPVQFKAFISDQIKALSKVGNDTEKAIRSGALGSKLTALVTDRNTGDATGLSAKSGQSLVTAILLADIKAEAKDGHEGGAGYILGMLKNNETNKAGQSYTNASQGFTAAMELLRRVSIQAKTDEQFQDAAQYLLNDCMKMEVDVSAIDRNQLRGALNTHLNPKNAATTMTLSNAVENKREDGFEGLMLRDHQIETISENLDMISEAVKLDIKADASEFLSTHIDGSDQARVETVAQGMADNISELQQKFQESTSSNKFIRDVETRKLLQKLGISERGGLEAYRERELQYVVNPYNYASGSGFMDILLEILRGIKAQIAQYIKPEINRDEASTFRNEARTSKREERALAA